MQWHREITRQQWRTLIAAQLGWMLDAMDVMLYSFALTAIRAEFHLSSAAAGALGFRPRFVDGEGAAIEFGAIESADGLLLRDDALVEFFFHAQQLLRFFFLDAGDGNAIDGAGDGL